MQVKVFPILIIAMIMLLAVMPAAAYDYRGVPRPGENNPDILDSEEVSTEDEAMDLGAFDFSSLFESADFSSLIMLIISFFLQLLGGAST
jgi:hypothetical protein